MDDAKHSHRKKIKVRVRTKVKTPEAVEDERQNRRRALGRAIAMFVLVLGATYGVYVMLDIFFRWRPPPTH